MRFGAIRSEPRCGVKRAFTVIEMLVVVLILAVIMCIALPLYLDCVEDAQTKSCRANLQVIADAIVAARVNSQSADYSPFIGQPIGSSTEPDLSSEPVCPTGGSYTVSMGDDGAADTFAVVCTQHGSFQPGHDRF